MNQFRLQKNKIESMYLKGPVLQFLFRQIRYRQLIIPIFELPSLVAFYTMKNAYFVLFIALLTKKLGVLNMHGIYLHNFVTWLT